MKRVYSKKSVLIYQRTIIVFIGILILFCITLWIRHRNTQYTPFRFQPAYRVSYNDIAQNPTPKIVPMFTPIPVDSLIQLTIPSGWIKRPDQAGRILLQTEKEKPGPGRVSTAVVTVLILPDVNNTNETIQKRYAAIYDHIHKSNGGAAIIHDLTYTTIAGKKAISYFYSHEIHGHNYEMIVGNFHWEIVVSSPEPSDELAYQADLNSIFSSFVFK